MGFGFGFGLFFIIILIPLTGIMLLVWLITKNNAFGKLVGFIWLGILGLIILVMLGHFFTDKKKLTQDDIYGEYIIDRGKFRGTQADWQYNHFRFEITKKNEFLFYLKDKEKVTKMYRGNVKFLEAYKGPRIVLSVDTPRHHIIEDMPTLYRSVWSFYYVFHSPKFGNVFFTKGKWKPI